MTAEGIGVGGGGLPEGCLPPSDESIQPDTGGDAEKRGTADREVGHPFFQSSRKQGFQ